MQQPWYELYPDRYDEELQALADFDITCSVDAKALQSKVMLLHLEFDGGNPNLGLNRAGEVIRLDVKFPDYYPWFRPEVFAPEISLPRHQGLLEKNLCLLQRGSRFWNTDFTVARLLQENLSVVFEKGSVEDPEVIKVDTTEQAEPYGEYYPSNKGTSILFDPTGIDLNGKSEFEFIGKVNIGIERNSNFPYRLIVRDTYNKGGSLVHTIPSAISSLFPETMTGYLYRTSNKPLIVADPTKLIDWLKKGLEHSGESFQTYCQNKRVGDYKYNQVIGLSFTHEVQPGVYGPGWIFCVTLTGEPPIPGNKKIGRKAAVFHYFAKPSYIHADAKMDRIPTLIELSEKSVAVSGLGALGGHAAIELARAGIREIRILDFDEVDPPTTVRWPLGISAAGKLKTQVLKEFIELNYPTTRVIPFFYRFGEIRQHEISVSDQVDLATLLDQFLDGVNVLLDATAEEGVNSFLNVVALRRSLPAVFMYATTGAIGGVAFYSIPGETKGCWNCVKSWEAYDPEKYFPPFDDKGEIQPPGCGDKTFTGTGFDLLPVTLAAVKMVVGILLRNVQEGYPLLGKNWAILRQIDEKGSAILPRWEEHVLTKHPNCSYCGKK